MQPDKQGNATVAAIRLVPHVADPKQLRGRLGRFATGVTVVTYETGSGPRGATVNAFSSVSLDPPLVLVSIARRAKACTALEGQPLCVNVLGTDQVDVALAFAGARNDVDIRWTHGGGAPRLLRAHASIYCMAWRTYDGGDHMLFLGKVQDFVLRDVEPLLFYAGKFHHRGDGRDNDGHPQRARSLPAVPLTLGPRTAE